MLKLYCRYEVLLTAGIRARTLKLPFVPPLPCDKINNNNNNNNNNKLETHT